jgi:hypothetical protein
VSTEGGAPWWICSHRCSQLNLVRCAAGITRMQEILFLSGKCLVILRFVTNSLIISLIKYVVLMQYPLFIPFTTIGPVAEYNTVSISLSGWVSWLTLWGTPSVVHAQICSLE